MQHTNQPQTPLWCWGFLLLAIVLEVAGTSFLKYGQDSWPRLTIIIMISLMCLSYFCLAKSVTVVPVGVAYAIWEGLGLVLIVIVSVNFLGETLTVKKAAGLSCLLIGSLLVHLGTDKTGQPASKKPLLPLTEDEQQP